MYVFTGRTYKDGKWIHSAATNWPVKLNVLVQSMFIMLVKLLTAEYNQFSSLKVLPVVSSCISLWVQTSESTVSSELWAEKVPSPWRYEVCCKKKKKVKCLTYGVLHTQVRVGSSAPNIQMCCSISWSTQEIWGGSRREESKFKVYIVITVLTVFLKSQWLLDMEPEQSKVKIAVIVLYMLCFLLICDI